jgi:hypothetical protein
MQDEVGGQDADALISASIDSLAYTTCTCSSHCCSLLYMCVDCLGGCLSRCSSQWQTLQEWKNMFLEAYSSPPHSLTATISQWSASGIERFALHVNCTELHFHVLSCRARSGWGRPSRFPLACAPIPVAALLGPYGFTLAWSVSRLPISNVRHIA